MNLEKAAQALVECGYAAEIHPDGDYILLQKGTFNVEPIDPINNEAQRQALLEWFKVTVMPDKDEWEASAPDENWDGAELYNSHHEAWGKTRLEAENACLSEILK